MRNPADAFSKYSNYFKNCCASFFCLFYLSTVNLDRIIMDLDYVHEICYSSPR